jgi:dihydrolipoamide dehydrogenase
MTDGLLPGVDRDLVKPLERRLATLLDNRIHLQTTLRSWSDGGETIEVVLEREGQCTTESYSHVLVAVGRQPAAQRLGLENTRVQRDPRGFIITDARRQTGEPTIYAIGDVAGEPMLAHKATHEARIAVDAILGRPEAHGARAIPAVVFTDPEIAWAGLTQAEAQQSGQPYRVATYPWAASGRAHSLGRPDGLTKWLVDPDSGRVLGCGIVGTGAGELIAEAVLALDRHCTVDDVASSIHPHPTLSETLMNAADVDLGTAIEIYKPRRR